MLSRDSSLLINVSLSFQTNHMIHAALYHHCHLLLSVSSVHSSERLEKEKEDLRAALEDALQKLQEQHRRDLAELEQKLHTFYQAEWDKVHLNYQEEADKCKALLQQQVRQHLHLNYLLVT